MRTSSRRRFDLVLIGLGTVVVGALAGGAAALAGRDEQIDRYWVSAAVEGDGSARVTEVLDYDFGLNSRHGITRWVPGLPPGDGVAVDSPDAPDQVLLTPRVEQDRRGGAVDGVEIRVGDPDVTVTARHRYRIGYDLPAVRRGDVLDWEAVGTGWPVTVDDVEVHLTAPFEVDSPRCLSGPAGSSARCEVRQVEPGHLVARVEDLDAHEGVSIEGERGAALAAAPPSPVPPSGRPPAEPRTNPFGPAGAAAAAAVAAALPGTVLVRRAGRETVYEGGAADAAFGGPPLGGPGPWPPLPGPGAPGTGAVPGTALPAPGVAEPPSWEHVPPPPGAVEHRVSATELERLATIEFAPPSQLSPAHGGIVLSEAVRPEHKVAWLVQAAIDGAVELDDGAGPPTVRPADLSRASTEQRAVLEPLLGSGRAVELGRYDPEFARAWQALDAVLADWRERSGLWDHRGDVRRRAAIAGGAVGAVVGAAVALAAGVVAGTGGATALWLAVAVVGGVLAGLGLAAVVGAHELRVRSAAGSALWLRVESFRRFLARSEAAHAEEAARRGVLREYTAWAVAVGEVGRWTRAVQSAAIAPDVAGLHDAALAPLLVHAAMATTVAPSASGTAGGFGGGFGGGSVGGGAGGGGGGSW